jgi:hypothetical protein
MGCCMPAHLRTRETPYGTAQACPCFSRTFPCSEFVRFRGETFKRELLASKPVGALYLVNPDALVEIRPSQRSNT